MQYHDIIRAPEGAETVVLLLHGILSAPQYFDFLLREIPPEFAVCGILLAGHGGTPEGLARTNMHEWKRQVSEAAAQLQGQYRRVLIAAHSMGTLFAVQLAAQMPIDGMLLLNVPVYPHLTLFGAVGSLAIGCGLQPKRDPRLMAMHHAYSISPDIRLWRYLWWIPRYLELFREIRKTRPLLKRCRTRAVIWQAARDELVSLRSLPKLAENPNFQLHCLRSATHFYYPENEKRRICCSFRKMLRGKPIHVSQRDIL